MEILREGTIPKALCEGAEQSTPGGEDEKQNQTSDSSEQDMEDFLDQIRFVFEGEILISWILFQCGI